MTVKRLVLPEPSTVVIRIRRGRSRLAPQEERLRRIFNAPIVSTAQQKHLVGRLNATPTGERVSFGQGTTVVEVSAKHAAPS